MAVAEREGVAVEFSLDDAEHLGDHHLAALGPVEFADERPLALVSVLRQRQRSPEAASLLMGDVDDDVPLGQTGLLVRAGIVPPLRRRAGDDRVGLPGP